MGLQLPEGQDAARPTNVCVGAEWHRFPSSFFLPSPHYRLAFIPSGFTGLLPADFDVTLVGSALIDRLIISYYLLSSLIKDDAPPGLHIWAA